MAGFRFVLHGITWAFFNVGTRFISKQCYDDVCNEKEVVSVANSMVANGLVKLGYDWVLLDDCWAATNRTASGEIQADATRFPSGTLQPLAQYLATIGMKLAVYTDVGAKTCRGGRLGSWPHYADDAATFVQWGVSGVKMDWCNHPAQLTQQQLYTNFSSALNSTGVPLLFNICGWGLNSVWQWGGKVCYVARKDVRCVNLPRKCRLQIVGELDQIIFQLSEWMICDIYVFKFVFL